VPRRREGGLVQNATAAASRVHSPGRLCATGTSTALGDRRFEGQDSVIDVTTNFVLQRSTPISGITPSSKPSGVGTQPLANG
jgi:hypothetical protein